MTTSWNWFCLMVVIVHCAIAQDINLNNNNPYDINNNNNPSLSTNSPNNFDINNNNNYNNNNPYNTQDSLLPTQYGDDTNNNNREYGRDNQSGQLDQYGRDNNENSDQFNGQQRTPNTQFDPLFGKSDQFGGRGGGQQTPAWKTNPFNSGGGGGWNQIENHVTTIREATYFIVASKMVRPGQLYRVSVNILSEKQPLTVRASILHNGIEMSEDHKIVKENIPETLLMRVPRTSVPGDYKLKVEGLYEDVLGGSAFVNETKLVFSQRYMTIFIQLDKPVYMQGEKGMYINIWVRTLFSLKIISRSAFSYNSN